MHVTIVAVTSIDGRLTNGQDTSQNWASPEDAQHFKQQLSKHGLIVLGKNTYTAMRPAPQAGKLRVVLTQDPSAFAAEQVEGALEFSSESPTQLVTRLEKLGHQDMLLSGGGHVFTSFLQCGLVSEIFMTIEPLIFGLGTSFVDNVQLDTQFKLDSATKLNEKGSLLLHYVTCSTN